MAIVPDIAELVANGYTISLRRDEADHSLIYFTLGRNNESATFHGPYLKALIWAYHWAVQQ